MKSVAIAYNKILPSTEKAIDTVKKLETIISKADNQLEIETHHLIHGGMYARTIKIPAGGLISGALIKLATIVIIQGDVLVYAGHKAIEFYGYNVFAASAMRKQAFVAMSNVNLTMVFPTQAKTVAEAEQEFTDEANLLLSRRQKENSFTTMTGE